MAAGFIQPGPKTQHLWDQLNAAKAAGDRDTVGKLTQEIRKISLELLKAGEREYGCDQNNHNQAPTA